MRWGSLSKRAWVPTPYRTQTQAGSESRPHPQCVWPLFKLIRCAIEYISTPPMTPNGIM